jgi:hypothetical protein
MIFFFENASQSITPHFLSLNISLDIYDFFTLTCQELKPDIENMDNFLDINFIP